MGDNLLQFDVAVIGGGPAGMAAALWCDELHLSGCLIEQQSTTGGQLNWIYNPIKNYPGSEFRDGSECAAAFRRSILQRDFTLLTDAKVSGIDLSSSSIQLADDRKISAKYFVLATGVSRNQLRVPGEYTFRGRGILSSGSRDRQQASGARVAVIGGGDAALENAMILADHAERVFLIHRRDEFAARKEFVDAVRKDPRIEVVLNSRVREFGGSDRLEFVDIERSGISERLAVERAVVRIGVHPNSDLVRHAVACDARGYILVDNTGLSSTPNLYAIGDVANPASPTISTAVGTASSAIKSVVSRVR